MIVAVIPFSRANSKRISIPWPRQGVEGRRQIPWNEFVRQDASNLPNYGIGTYGVTTASERKVNKTAMESQSARTRPAVWQVVQAFSKILHDVEGVEGVLGDQTAEGLTLTVVMNNPSKEHRREIYDCEWKLTQRYSDASFDFHLIDRRDRPLCDVASIELSDIYVRG
jgi:hypothetical protein